MKRTGIALLLVLALLLTGCGGKTRQVVVEPWESQLYSDEDVQQAVDVVCRYFQQNFGGCTLVWLGYAGDERQEVFQEWAQQYDMDQVIILTSEFDVDGRGGAQRVLEPHATYTNFQWILARDAGGTWQHKDHGYG